MVNPYKIFKVDGNLAREGVWVTVKGCRFKVGQAGVANPKFTAAVEMLTAPYREQLSSGSLDPAVAMEINRKAFAMALVYDWDITDENGNAWECTPENVDKMTIDLPELYVAVNAETVKVSNFQRKLEDRDLGNLKRSSSGKKRKVAKKKT